MRMVIQCTVCAPAHTRFAQAVLVLSKVLATCNFIRCEILFRHC